MANSKLIVLLVSSIFLILSGCNALFQQFFYAQQLEVTQTQLDQITTAAIAEQYSPQQLEQELRLKFNIEFFQYKNNDITGLPSISGHWINPNGIANWLFPKHTFVFDKQNVEIRIRLQQAHENQIRLMDLLLTLTSLLVAYLLILIVIGSHRRTLNKQIQQLTDAIAANQTITLQSTKNQLTNKELIALSTAIVNCIEQVDCDLKNNQQQFNNVAKLAYLDPVTHLQNRHKFNQKLSDLTTHDQHFNGVAVMFKAAALININQHFGTTAGDHYLLTLTKQIIQEFKKIDHFSSCQCFYRIDASRFVILIDNVQLEPVLDSLAALKQEFEQYQQRLKMTNCAYSAAIGYLDNGSPHLLVEQLEKILFMAEMKGPNQYHSSNSVQQLTDKPIDNWQQILKHIINNHSFDFYQQPILPLRGTKQLYRELFTRFQYQGNTLATDTVFTMAHQYGLQLELDQLITRKIVDLIEQKSNESDHYGVNLTDETAVNPKFHTWLKQLLQHHPTAVFKLVFEINETALQINQQACIELIHIIRGIGAKVTIEHFGQGFTSIKFFSEVATDYIKLTPQLTTESVADSNHRFFLKLLVDICKRKHRIIIATGVETIEQKHTLEKLLVDGIQGVYAAPPKPLQKSGLMY
ncbi:bifunctional diguanylate cyclase/phosphodiesterase [Shewanella marina]|uniref:bifunctional diguanylate cyclase/phosphodiesterase n=1 Tax=Shewanella marina TaxID=487319 RepID=UPI00046E64ED|nr:GGDEF domain-containing protein [Shewanella marina]